MAAKAASLMQLDMRVSPYAESAYKVKQWQPTRAAVRGPRVRVGDDERAIETAGT